MTITFAVRKFPFWWSWDWFGACTKSQLQNDVLLSFCVMFLLTDSSSLSVFWNILLQRYFVFQDLDIKGFLFHHKKLTKNNE